MASSKINSSVVYLVGFSALAFVIGAYFANQGLLLGMALVGIACASFFVVKSYLEPEFTLKFSFVMSFFVLGMVRYIQLPLGLVIDLLLAFTLVIVILKAKHYPIKSVFRYPIVWLSAIWMLYVLFELLNPEMISMEAWFYSMRGVSLYFVLIAPLVILLLNKPKDLNWLLNVWLMISLLAALKGFGQQYIGLDPFEQRWMDTKGAITHLLFGHLRVFSFYAEAAQFGGSMAQVSLASFILMFGPYSFARKTAYLVMGIIFFWAFMISGTRGALAVFMFGVLALIILNRNWKLLGALVVVGSLAVYLLMFTYVGQANYDIRRMRYALQQGTKIKSVEIRMETREKLSAYLETRPFGGGVGSSSFWGQRFTPDTFLAQIETDGWYTRLWAECGIVGLLYYVGIIIYFILVGGRRIWVVKDFKLRNQMVALYASIVGVVIASWSSSTISQFPTGILTYIGMTMILVMEPSLEETKEISQSQAELI